MVVLRLRCRHQGRGADLFSICVCVWCLFCESSLVYFLFFWLHILNYLLSYHCQFTSSKRYIAEVRDVV